MSKWTFTGPIPRQRPTDPYPTVLYQLDVDDLPLGVLLCEVPDGDHTEATRLVASICDTMTAALANAKGA